MMERLGDEIRRELERVGPGGDELAAITRAWAGSVGDTIARNAWPARLAADGTLHVATVSSTWAFELARLAGTILERLQPALGKGTPRALKFAPGPVPEPPEAPARQGAPKLLQVTPAERAEAADLAAEIDDGTLRELVARAAAASLAKGRRAAPDDRRF